MGGARRPAAPAAGTRVLRGARDALTVAAFAGAYGAGADASRLVWALRRDGEARVVAAAGPLAVAAAPAPSGAPACVCTGRPRTDRLACRLGADPGLGAPELIATGYRKLGGGVLELIDGEFALAAWSPAAGSAIVARDRVGARPLFVHGSGGVLLFASEVRNLIAALPGRPAPDPDAMARWLARAPLGDRTLYRGIERLPPGHAIHLEDGRPRTRGWWQPRARPARVAGVDDAARAVRRGLDDAVARAIGGASHPALLLSGGLDSAAVAAASREQRPACYSGVFPDRPAVDETDRLRSVRRALGLHGVEAALGCGSALAATAEFIAEWELPSLSPHRFVWAPLYRRAAADGVDVLLTGDGGDELFGVAPFLIADRLRALDPRGAVRLARRLPGMGAAPRPRWTMRALGRYGARALLPASVHEPLRRARGRSGAPAWLAAPVVDDHWAWKANPGPRWAAQLVDLLTTDALGTGDQHSREAAMHGFAFGHPLRDPGLIELVLALPPQAGFDPVLDRPVLRRALAGELPDSFLADVRKPTFDELLRDAIAGPDRPLARDLLIRCSPGLAELVRESEVASLPPRAAEAAAPRSLPGDIWRLASAELWLRYQSDPRALDLPRDQAAPEVGTPDVP